MREYFCAYHSMLGAMRKLSDAECGRLFRALLAYSSGEQPDNLQGREELLFDVFSQQIDRDSEKYTRKCETNKANGSVRKRSEANGSVRKRSEANGSVRTQDKEKEKDKSSPLPPFGGFAADDELLEIARTNQAVYDKAADCGFDCNTATLDRLTALIGDHGPDKVLRGLDECVEHGAKSLAYLRKVLSGEGGKKPPQPDDGLTDEEREMRRRGLM